MQDDDAYTRESWSSVEAKNRGKCWIPVDAEHEYYQCPWCGKDQTVLFEWATHKCPYCGGYVYKESEGKS